MSSTPNCFQTPIWTHNWKASQWILWKNIRGGKDRTVGEKLSGFELSVCWLGYLKSCRIYLYISKGNVFIPQILFKWLLGTWHHSRPLWFFMDWFSRSCKFLCIYEWLSVDIIWTSLFCTFSCLWGQTCDLELSRKKWHLTDWQLWFILNISYPQSLNALNFNCNAASHT